MRSEPPPLLPIFRSRHQAELLTRLFLNPAQEFTLSELLEYLGTPMTTLHREAERLVTAGLVLSRTVGRTRLLRANAEHQVAKPLTNLLAMTFGPREIVAAEFGTIPSIERVIIFGSWAARYHGVDGPTPHDLDILVTGPADVRGAVYDAAERVQRRLGIAVNPVLSSRARWAKASDALIREIKAPQG